MGSSAGVGQHGRVTDEQNRPIDHAVDLVVYAPIGFVVEARKLIPSLAERGRQQVQMAKVVGQFTVEVGRKEAERRRRKLRSQTDSFMADLGLAPAKAEASEQQRRSVALRADVAPALRVVPPSPTEESDAGAADAAAPAKPSRSAKAPRATKVPKRTPSTKSTRASHAGQPPDGESVGSGVGPAAVSLAISDYDSLAASQVIPRLAGLSSEELDTVQRYERHNRGRKTILGRIAQLQSE